MKPKDSKFYNMGLNEVIEFNEETEVVRVRRVPGGWIYETSYTIDDSQVGINATFVPYNEEFFSDPFLNPEEHEVGFK